MAMPQPPASPKASKREADMASRGRVRAAFDAKKGCVLSGWGPAARGEVSSPTPLPGTAVLRGYVTKGRTVSVSNWTGYGGASRERDGARAPLKRA